MTLTEHLLALAHGDERAVLFTVVEGDRGVGSKVLVLLDRGEVIGDDPLGLARLAAEQRRNGTFEHEGLKVFAEVFGPPPRLVVVGAVDTGEALCAAARQVGWRTICVDARAQYATPERVPSADQIVVEWPEPAFEQILPDRDTAVVVLTHDDKFDIPALAVALRSEAFYVGALGSRRAQAKRRERLLEAGVTEQQLERLRGPAGLDIGAESPAETAVSIIGEALALRAGAPRRPSARRRAASTSSVSRGGRARARSDSGVWGIWSARRLRVGYRDRSSVPASCQFSSTRFPAGSRKYSCTCPDGSSTSSAPHSADACAATAS